MHFTVCLLNIMTLPSRYKATLQLEFIKLFSLSKVQHHLEVKVSEKILFEVKLPVSQAA